MTSAPTLAACLIAELDNDTLDDLAARLAPRLLSMLNVTTSPQWLDVKAAAEHLACPTSRIYALVSAGRIPFHKDGSRTLFSRQELDEWVRAGGAKRP